MEQAELSTLRAVLLAQLAQIEAIYAKIEERKPARTPVELESLGYQLHNLYCACEELLRLVADRFENRLTDRTRWHRELLLRMSVPIEGVRPALLSPDTFRLLDSLRAFRHFFRHGYTYELDPRKLRIVLEDALALRERLKSDVRRFLETLGTG